MQTQMPDSNESSDASIAPAIKMLDDVIAALTQIEAEQQSRAQHAFDAYSETRDADLECLLRSSVSEIAAKIQASKTERFTVVAQMLDVDSLPWFLELMAAEHQRALLAARAPAAGKARQAKSKQGQAKLSVKECWDEWQQKPSSYDDDARFAIDMLDKYTDLKSQIVIQRWCDKWREEKDALSHG